jgi:hypothetical protein
MFTTTGPVIAGAGAGIAVTAEVPRSLKNSCKCRKNSQSVQITHAQ